MKIAIHHRPGSFSDRWIEYCKNQSIEYKIVNAYDSDIVEQVADCDAFMWHHHQSDYRDVLFANQLLYSLEARGVKCFPDFRTTWHFDDKIGQKYLLESIGGPLVPSYVFYTKKEAMEWIQRTSFPKVFKLRGGAGAANVCLAHNKKEAKRLVSKAFGKGFTDKSANVKERFRKFREGKEPFSYLLKGIGRVFFKTDFAKMHGREKGYAYFQDFIANNLFDIRVIVIGDKAFAIKRMVRKGDFRASGSGNILYDRSDIPEKCVQLSFEVSAKLKAQCVAYDYVFDADEKPAIVEISYGFAMHGYDPCPGYWTLDMEWHEGRFNPQEWMVQDLIKKQ